MADAAAAAAAAIGLEAAVGEQCMAPVQSAHRDRLQAFGSPATVEWTDRYKILEM